MKLSQTLKNPLRLSRDNAVLGAIVLAESAWLYGAFAIVGAVLEKDGSPLGWLAVLLILGLGVAAARLIPTDVAAIEALYLGVTLLGAFFMYLVVATQVEPGLGFDFAWMSKLVSSSEPDPYGFRAIGGILIGIGVWVRGITIAIAADPSRNLGISFSLGIVILAVALMLDSALEYDLGIGSLVFIFFGAGLAGLSVGTLRATRSAKAKAWPRIIGGMIVAMTLIGAMFTVVSRDILSYVTDPISTVLGFVLKGALLVVLAPVALVFTLIFGGVEDLFGREFDVEPAGGGFANSSEPGFELAEVPDFEFLTTTEEQMPEPSAGIGFDFAAFLQWASIALLVVGGLVIMFLAIRKIVGRERGPGHAHREAVDTDADYASDFGNLLWKILPDRFRGRRRKGMQPPDGPPGIVEVFQIYYRLLKMAEQKGQARSNHQTTVEFQGPLTRVVTPELARLATYLFDRACYGYHPASEDQLGHLRLALQQRTSQ